MNSCNISLFKHFYSVQNCLKCQTLSPHEKFSHKWKGNIDASAMILSEAPGRKSIDKQKMWAGSTGKRLRNILSPLGYTLEEIFYMTDVIKCLPENNRDPFEEEIKNCQHFLKNEIEILKPKYILSFGRFALDTLAKLYRALTPIPDVTITDLHTNDGYTEIQFENFKVLVLVHPSAAGRMPHKLTYDNYRKHLIQIFSLIITIAVNENNII